MGLLSDLQGGFREQRGTEDQIFILLEIIASRRERGLSTFLAFVDVRKAYDRVWRAGLWRKLDEAEMGGRVTDIIQTMYKKVVRTILINGERTGDFEVQAGVPQGAVLSPFLYAMYIDGLRQKGLGVRIAGRLVPLLLYADDVVLLARTSEEMKAMHGVLEQYARQWRFEIHHGKSNIVVAGSTVPQPPAGR